jgi:hypothetical protein
MCIVHADSQGSHVHHAVEMALKYQSTARTKGKFGRFSFLKSKDTPVAALRLLDVHW